MKKALFLAFLAGNLTAQVPIVRLSGTNFSEHLSIKIEPKNSKLVSVFIDSTIFKSNNGGLTWNKSSQHHFLSSAALFSTSYNCSLNTDGFIYNCGVINDTIVFQKSEDAGKTWLDKPVKVAWAKKASSYNVNGVTKANGLPAMAVDNSNGPFKNRIYICWSDEKSGEKNKDVFISYSDNNGADWTDPIVVTYYPNHKEQFMPAIAVDETTGFIYILYYGQQNYLTPGKTDIYLAVSKDGCTTFNYSKLNDTPIQFPSFGKNLSLDVLDGGIKALWRQNFLKSKASIVTASINDSILNSILPEQELELPKMNEFSKNMSIVFKSRRDMKVDAVLYKSLDPKFEKVLFRNKKIKAGSNTLSIKTQKEGLQNETYILILYYNNRTTYTWITAN